MKTNKIYSFDECINKTKVIAKLDSLQNVDKIEYELIDSDLIKVKDISLTAKEIKDLYQFLHDNDVLEDHDFDTEDDEEDEEDSYDDY